MTRASRMFVVAAGIVASCCVCALPVLVTAIQGSSGNAENKVALPRAAAIESGFLEFYNHPLGTVQGGPYPNRDQVKLSQSDCEAALAEFATFGELVTREPPEHAWELGSLRLVNQSGFSTRVCWFFTGGKNKLLLTVGGKWVCAAKRTSDEGEESLAIDSRLRERFTN